MDRNIITEAELDLSRQIVADQAGLSWPGSPGAARREAEAAEELAAADQAVLRARGLVSRALTDRAGDPYTPEHLALIAGRYAVEARAWSRLGYALGRTDLSQAIHLAVWTAHTQAVGFSREWRRRANRLAAELGAEAETAAP